MVKRAWLIGVLILLEAPFARAACMGRVDGEVIAKVVGIERLRDRLDNPSTRYSIATYWDSTYVDTVHVPRPLAELWTPGDGKGVGTFETLFGPLSTVSMAMGEKIRATYRMMDGHPYLVGKWTVWKAEQSREHGCRADIEKIAAGEVSLERFLSDRSRVAQFADSLVLCNTRFVADVYYQRTSGRDWKEYGAFGGLAVSLRAQREKERAEAQSAPRTERGIHRRGRQ
jgi:hypothetical protein